MDEHPDEPTERVPTGGPALDPPETTFVLHVTDGQDRGARHAIGGEAPARIVVGTGALADFRLTGRRVSRAHVALSLEGSALVVTDLGSMNGTWVGGLRIREVELRGGEQLTIGESVMSVEKGPLARAAMSRASRFGEVLGQSRGMRRLYPLLQKLAETNIPVVLQGEAGTGKELVAESLHREGPRQAGPFCIVDTGAIPAAQLETTLFGLFEQANGGTLLIEDIAEIDLGLQARLLRFLEHPRAGLDVRVVVATRRDLDREVQAGRFRDDLFHRVAVARVELPPLRKREGDIALLAEAFATEAGATLGRIAPSVLEAWNDAPWPGNVRELRQQVARHLALGELAPLSYEAPPSQPPPPPGDWLEAILAERLPLIEAREKVVAAFHGRYVARMLTETGGNVVRAAARAGVARRYFQILKAKHRIE